MLSPTPQKVDDLESQTQTLQAGTSLSMTSPTPSYPYSRTSTVADELSQRDPRMTMIAPEDEKRELRLSSASTTTLAHPEDAHIRDNNGKKAHEAGVIERSQAPSSASLAPSHTSVEEYPVPDTENGTDEKKSRYEVGWDGPDDPEDPHNWTRLSRWYYTVLASMLVFNATFASSSPGGIVVKAIEEFGFSLEVATLMISLFLAGYCVGPLFWGPLSEIYGRKPIFVISFALYTGFQVGCALSPNTAAILIFRFLGGCAASSPLANAGALIGDIWDSKTRGKAVALFTLAPFAGPAIGPVVGGFIGTSPSASWRWLFWVLTIFAGSCLIFIVFTLPETYAPIILKRKAQRLRKETGDVQYYAPIERNSPTVGQRINDVLTKPWKILFYEPMLLAITIYMSFVYGCLYLLFEAYPIVFEEGHGFNSGEDGLAFLPLFLGGIIGSVIAIFYYNPRYVKLIDEYAPKSPPPEARLPMGVIGGFIFAIGFFWFGWTSYPSVSYWAPLTSGFAFGISLMFLFLSLLNYIIDTYLHESASALSANTIVRSIFGATFPLFARQMYNALNPRWASTLIGCVAVLMIPIPALFIRYGPELRKRSRYSPTA